MTTLMIEIIIPDNLFTNDVYHFLLDSTRFACRLCNFDPFIQAHFKSFVEMTMDEIEDIVKEALTE